MGEEIAAWLRLAPGREMSEQDVKSFLKGKVREGTLSTFDKKSIKPRLFFKFITAGGALQDPAVRAICGGVPDDADRQSPKVQDARA